MGLGEMLGVKNIKIETKTPMSLEEFSIRSRTFNLKRVFRLMLSMASILSSPFRR